MKNETARREIESLDYYFQHFTRSYSEKSHMAMMTAIKALSQEPCDDAISRDAVLDACSQSINILDAMSRIEDLPSVTPKQRMGHCRDCKWWKDSDGVYRRGIGAESQCPINRKEVYEGNGYCFLFEPQESEGNNG